ncbi:Uncharacterized protein SCF082_LOCUS5591 [Durusdinium trenchii]|uniref:Uncharacterized protein n=1 Tax=Durusdinium trenchii TaxID=1381693 RepID=A0ABP0I6W2_9DINO
MKNLRANGEQMLGNMIGVEAAPNLSGIGAQAPFGDTWDHFKIPDCDPGPPEGTKKWVTTVENVKTWVNDTIGRWVKPMWYMDPKDENGGHWVDGHIEYPGHYEMKPRNVSRWVVVHKTAKQQDCFYKQNDANEYHQKLIKQHEDFVKSKQEDEDLLRWQGEHKCLAQLVNVDFVVMSVKVEPKGSHSGGLCQKLCTVKGYDGFTWTSEGCWLKKLGPGITSFQAQPLQGAYSGYACAKVATYLPWLTDEAQRHTLIGVGHAGAAPLAAATGSMLCVMLLKPYSADLDLVIEQQKLDKGIFSCESWALYSSQVFELPSGLKTRKIYASQMVEKGGQWNVVLDTDVLMAFYREVLKDPEWREAKWIVRADPECIFYPVHLKTILFHQEQVGNVDASPTYLVSADTAVGFPRFFQVMSQSALRQLATDSRSCFWRMRYWGNSQYHGSMWFDSCLNETVHARRVKPPKLIADGPAGAKEESSKMAPDLKMQSNNNPEVFSVKQEPERVKNMVNPVVRAERCGACFLLGRRFDYTATADLAMSAAVYAVHAAQWAQRGALSAPGPRREFFSQLRLRLLRQVPDAPLRCAGWKEVAYGTMLRQWEEEQAKILAKTWKGRLQATKGRLGPVVVSCTSSVAVFITSDLMVQKAVEKRPEVDVTRTSVMGLFGLGYAGFAQHFLYTRLWPFILQAARLSGPRAVAFQVLGDQGFYMPLIYLPIFYSTKEMACTNKLLWETAQAGVLRWQENLAADLTLCSGYWIPVQAFRLQTTRG